MAPPNVTWQSIIQQAMVSADVLKQSEVVRNVQNISADQRQRVLLAGHAVPQPDADHLRRHAHHVQVSWCSHFHIIPQFERPALSRAHMHTPCP